MILHLVDLKEGVVIKWASCGGRPTGATGAPGYRSDSRPKDVI